MSDTKVKTSPQISKAPPSSIQMATELIKNNPELFTNDYATLLAIADAMVIYQNKCNEFINQTPVLEPNFNHVLKAI